MTGAPWTLPAFLEPYRQHVLGHEGHSIESIMNASSPHVSFDSAIRQVSVAHQVALLKSLMAAGLLLVAVPAKPTRAPSKATKAKRAKRGR